MGEEKTWFCYLLFSNDGRKTYVGATIDVKRRLRQHNGELCGGAKRTSSHRPWSLAAHVEVGDKIKALKLEWRMKRTKGPKKRLALFKKVCQDSELTPVLSPTALPTAVLSNLS